MVNCSGIKRAEGSMVTLCPSNVNPIFASAACLGEGVKPVGWCEGTVRGQVLEKRLPACPRTCSQFTRR